MEYSLHQLSRLSGVSARTLRYYDQIGLLKPTRVDVTRYRYYNSACVDRLQTILFYRALDLPLATIATLLSDPAFDREAALKTHLSQLTAKKRQLEILIHTVQNTLLAMKGEIYMKDEEKFQGLKQSLVENNETLYGEEIRTRYGNEAIDAANQTFLALSPAEYQQAQALQEQLADLCKQAALQGDATGVLAKRAFELHKQWLCLYWPSYSPQAHKGLAALYLQDERFTAYYEAFAPGSARFLHDAILAHCQ